jgi:ATP-binding cassette, subfamily B, bacterial
MTDQAISERRYDDAAFALPEISVRRIFKLAVKSWPYMKPMIKHLLLLAGLTALTSLILAGAGFIGADIFTNKILVGDKLQPMQASIMLLDESYVATDITDNVNLQDSLSEDQRKVVRNRGVIWFVALALFLVPIFAALIYYNLWIWQMVNQNLRVAMIEKAENLSLKYHNQSRVGDAIFRVYQDSAMINSVIREAIVSPIMGLYGIILGLVLIAFFDPRIALICLATAIPIVIATVWITPRLRVRALANRIANSNLTSRMQETMAALKIVKANQGEQKVLRQFHNDSHAALDAAFYLRLNIALLNVGVTSLIAIVTIGVEYILVVWVLGERETFLGAAVATIIGFAIWNYGAFEAARGNLASALFGMTGMVGLWARLQDLFIGLERAFYLLDLEAEIVDPESPVPFPTPIESVQWKGVHFGYDDQTRVLKGVDLEARVGTITAIVGSSGAGKSTLMSLLLRLYDPDQGSVAYNGIDLRELKVQDIRDNTAIALQRNVLFAMSVADNIGYATKNATRSAIEEAARIACADDFVRGMDAGYDAELGERGGKLSTGQRQRLTIARAIVRSTPILILDEPTASLDAETELSVMRNLGDWGRDKIVFIITHRLSTIRNADQIVFLENGVVVETGSHDELMGNNAGRYHEFVTASHQVPGDE